MAAYRSAPPPPNEPLKRPRRRPIHLMEAAAKALVLGFLIIPANFFLYFATYKETLVPFLALAYAQVALGASSAALAVGHAFGGGRERRFLEQLLSLTVSGIGIFLAALGVFGAYLGERLAKPWPPLPPGRPY